MRPVALALAALLITLSLAEVSAQTPPAPPPTVILSPATGGLTTDHVARGTNLPPNADLTAVLFDPLGNQIPFDVKTGADGSFEQPLSLGTNSWTQGLYRLVIGLPDVRAVSGTFTASDGQQHLFAEPYLPSPTAAFNFVGTGLPPQTDVTVHVTLTGGHLGERDLPARTDANGAFSIYLWPGQVGAPFWPTGQYLVSVPQFSLTASFWVREHPASATISLPDPVEVGQATPIDFTQYAAHRFLWGVYAGSNGQAAGEFLVGPTNPSGNATASVIIPDLGSGPYYIATPSDWGEASFGVIEPTATPTATATATPLPTATKRPKPKPTPTPTRARAKHTKCKNGKKRKNGKCKR